MEGNLGAKLETAVACALLRDLHLLEDTTGSRVALHYIRDKEKREVDFLAVVDNKPVCMVEAKMSEDRFSPALFRLHENLPTAKPFQIVHSLRRNKSKGPARMVPTHAFFKRLGFEWVSLIGMLSVFSDGCRQA